jgi:drug/metabolite transporter (DMT)-like permease
MASGTVTLTAITVFLWGLIPILDKLALARFSGHPLIPIAVRVWSVALLVVPLAWVLARGGSWRAWLGPTTGAGVTWVPVALFAASGVVSLLLAQFAYYRLLQQADVSRVFPFLFSAAPVVTMLLGVLVLHETLTLRQLAGAVLVIGGGLLLL